MCGRLGAGILLNYSINVLMWYYNEIEMVFIGIGALLSFYIDAIMY